MLIDDYVAALGRAIVGPPGPKRDMVVEARDSLVDAAEALEADGLPRVEAERIAVAEFGAIGEVAPGYQEELTACAGRRLGVLLTVVGPLTWLIWYGVWRLFPGDPAAWADRPDWFTTVSRLMDGLQLFTGVLGLLTLLALTRVGRALGDVRLVTRMAAVYVWVLLPVTVGLCIPLMYGAEPVGGAQAYGPWAGAALATSALMGWQLRSAGVCLRLTRIRTA
ncbi:MAG TPA: permease prefix domain 1-containing protein [Thermomonospora sp.]|nr:permease prefix domain 1-containing protein [Thermomonospora sp.]